jgi:hypothetical protein
MSERSGGGGRPSLTDAFRGPARSPRRAAETAAAPKQPKQRRRREKTGKRSSPDYVQVSALVEKDVRARFAVVQAQASAELGRKVEFGELVNLFMAHFVLGEVSVEDMRESLEDLRAELR